MTCVGIGSFRLWTMEIKGKLWKMEMEVRGKLKGEN
jgi:hypothetical protein